MTLSHLGLQQVTLQPLNFSGTAEVCAGLDFNMIHEERGKSMWRSLRSGVEDGVTAIMAETLTTGNKLFSSFVLQSSQVINAVRVERDRFIGQQFTLELTQGKPCITRSLPSIARIVTPHGAKIVCGQKEWSLRLRQAD